MRRGPVLILLAGFFFDFLGGALGAGLGAPARAQELASERAQARIDRAVAILERLESGRELLAKARAAWALGSTRELGARLRPGAESKTDAVITRYFNPGTGEEHREREVLIHLRTEQRLEDLVLDLAHELVHAATRPAWDPYDPKLTPGDYIRAAIEGEGGEVAAVVAECRVGLEMAALSGASVERCRSYVPAGSTRVSADKVARDFYRVGKWSSELSRRLGSAALPRLSDDAPVLFSSTGRTPYPVALFREFEQINDIACENSRKRLQAVPGRTLASDARSRIRDFLQRRCD
ncbi:MAG: hypothetical protein NDJ89_09405 [Oligoflexia bacterium]|nr:hypothetical protein [Oligoflexia bacterium]